MHTSKFVLFLFLAAACLAVLTQILNYHSIEPNNRTVKRKAALVSGIAAIIISAVSGYMAAVDWAALPKSPDGLQRGQLWNNGGLPAITE